MIYTTVSGTPLPFLRLIKTMDEIAGVIGEEVVIQGAIEFDAQNAVYEKYYSREQASKLIKDARLVISHAGIGTIIETIRNQTPLIIVPRRKELNEHFNDHQMEIAKACEDREGIKVIYKVDQLKDAVNFSQAPSKSTEKQIQIINTIKSFVDAI